MKILSSSKNLFLFRCGKYAFKHSCLTQIIGLFIFPFFCYSQLDDTSSTSNGSMTLGNGTGTLYQFAGDQRGTDATNQSQGGFGILSGAHQISPIIWMYNNSDKNAFQVKRKNYGTAVQNGTTLFHVGANSRVGIGTTSPDAKLTVNGNIHSEKVKVDLLVPAPDYVFKEGYDLKNLEWVQGYIQENGHLPNIPSANEMEANGIQLGIMNMKLLEKIEELTLYTIKQEKEIRKNRQLHELVQKVTDIKQKNETICLYYNSNTIGNCRICPNTNAL